jgi:hypothetical protein
MGKSPFLMRKSPFLMGKSQFLMGKSTILWLIITNWKDPPFSMEKSTISTGPWLQ